MKKIVLITIFAFLFSGCLAPIRVSEPVQQKEAQVHEEDSYYSAMQSSLVLTKQK